jgi:hypothetical protein
LYRRSQDEDEDKIPEELFMKYTRDSRYLLTEYLLVRIINCKNLITHLGLGVSPPHLIYVDPDSDPAFLRNADTDPDPDPAMNMNVDLCRSGSRYRVNR